MNGKLTARHVMVVTGANQKKELGKIHKEVAPTGLGNNYNEGPLTTQIGLTQISNASLNTQNNSYINIASNPRKMSDFNNFDQNLSGTNYNPNNQGGTGGCFAGGQKVESKTRGIINIENIEIGEYIKTQNGWSRVYAWHMYTKNTSMEFVVVKHSNGELVLSDLHFIYVNNKPIVAKDIKINDTIIYKGEEVVVTEVTTKVSKGIYNPYTINGKIIVNNINCSVYPVCHPTLHHILTRIVLGIAYVFPKEINKYYNMTAVDSNSTQALQGMHKWIYIFARMIGAVDKGKVDEELTIEELKNE